MTSYPSDYAGHRYFKCDLQMQTPADAQHWCGPPMATTDSGMRTAADLYLRRCYEVGLHAIAITDHNFASKDFLPILRETADALSGEYGYGIVIFPGFEIEANVGRGLHCLAIFDPSVSLTEIDHIMTECGIPSRRIHDGVPASSQTRLADIVRIVQKRQGNLTHRGLVICPHSMGQSGIFDNDRISEWLQSAEFLNPELLCIEVPKPPSSMSAAWQRLLRAGDDCIAMWRRQRPIACIRSSDAKCLTQDQGANYIGFRSTWIKMSTPSIEGLRQAFLDHESRIRLDAPNPDELVRHPVISTIQVAGATFLHDQTIVLSRHLTAIIGGRGTGKSTLIEYLRIVLSQQASVIGADAQSGFRQISTGTIGSATEITISAIKDQTEWSLRSTGGGQSVVVSGPNVPDVGRLFPAKVLSQREIFAIAQDRAQVRMLIDDTASDVRERLKSLSDEIVDRIRRITRDVATVPELRTRKDALATDVQTTGAKLDRMQAVAQPLQVWQTRVQHHEQLALISHDAARLLWAVRRSLNSQGQPSRLEGEVPSEVANALAEAATARHEFALAVRSAARAFVVAIRRILSDPTVLAWYVNHDAAEQEVRQLLDGLDADMDGNTALLIQEDLKRLRNDIAQIDQKLQQIERDTLERERLFTELFAVWERETDSRRAAAERLTRSVPPTHNHQPFVEVSVYPYGDHQAFGARMVEYLADRRRVSDDDWREFMAAVCHASVSGPPTETLAAWCSQLRSHQQPPGCPWSSTDRQSVALLQWLSEERIQELRCWRTPDRVAVVLRRNDGTVVGDIDGGGLSVGQRCTAVLALLLARNDVPIIIDQPEDDLDNEFVFKELVPFLRRVKEKRQVIVVTHNANIPVNADAELIIALEVHDGRGRVQVTGDGLAVGGLDRPAVQLAVQNIMEGSDVAFRRRFEKYGF